MVTISALLVAVSFLFSIRKLYHKKCGKSSVFKRLKELYRTQSRHGFVCFWLFRFQPFHEPAVLLWRQCPDLVLGSWPLKTTIFQALIQKQKSISLPIQSLNPVSFPTTEQKECCLEGIHLELGAYHAGQTVNSAPQICIATGDIHWAAAVEVIQHERRVSMRAFSNSGCMPA